MSDYEFKNTALAKLYKKFMNNGPWLTVKPVDGMLEAFRECDETLADIQDQCEHWKTMYGNACGDQDVLKESIRLLDGENRDLKKRCEDLRKHNVDVITVNNKTIDQLREENEALKKQNEAQRHVIDDFVEKVSGKDDDIEKLDYMLQDLQREYDELKKDRDRKAEAVVKLAKKRDELQRECDELKNDSESLKNALDAWRNALRRLRDENKELQKRLTEANDILEETNRDRNEWRRRALMTKLTSTVPYVKEEYTMTVTMDNADYNDLMKLLWNKSFGASTEYMRAFLKEFCDDHDSCRVCPLKECGSDLGSSFDSMSDEEIEKYYKIAIRCYT